MVTFEDGPAAGAALALRRAPLLLRVVGRPTLEPTWTHLDALDQLDDAPEPHEHVAVYQRVGDASSMHLNTGRRGNAGNGWYAHAIYRHLVDVDGEQLRDTQAWTEWATRRAAAHDALPAVPRAD